MSTKHTQEMITEKKPRMLKEFLRDYSNYTNNNNSSSNSCSSSGFKSFSRSNLPDNSDPTVQNFLNQAATLPRSRSRSRAAAEAAFYSFQKLLNAVKSLHYSPTPSTLPRSISRRFSGLVKKRSKSSEVKIMVVKVKVKDILRWKSFRDLIVDQSQPLDYPVGPTEEVPIGCTCSSSESSEEESSEGVDTDFTVTEEEELPCCLGDSGDVEGKKRDEVIASDSEVGPKEDNDKIASDEDAEQQSPVYVLDSPFRDEVSDEEFPSSFDRSLANMERSKQRLLESIQWFESLAGVHEDDETEVTDDEEAKQEDHEQRSEEDHNVIDVKNNVRKELCWFKRGRESLVEKKECITEMEKHGKWSKFEEDREELGAELEVGMLSDLLDEVLIDLCG